MQMCPSHLLEPGSMPVESGFVVASAATRRRIPGTTNPGLNRRPADRGLGMSQGGERKNHGAAPHSGRLVRGTPRSRQFDESSTYLLTGLAASFMPFVAKVEGPRIF